MKHKTNWVNVFFMILVILIVISGICWFFGVRIPTFKGIQMSIERAKIPTTIDTGINCTAYVLEHWKSYDIIPGGFGGSEGDAELYISAKCAEVCSSQSVGIGTLNGVLVQDDMLHPYDCDDKTGNLICHCVK